MLLNYSETVAPIMLNLAPVMQNTLHQIMHVVSNNTQIGCVIQAMLSLCVRGHNECHENIPYTISTSPDCRHKACCNPQMLLMPNSYPTAEIDIHQPDNMLRILKCFSTHYSCEESICMLSESDSKLQSIVNYFNSKWFISFFHRNDSFNVKTFFG